MKICGIAASEHIDSSGESLVVAGADITSLNDGTAVFNFEHNNDDAEDVVGRINYGKKIFSEQDCETPAQLKFYKRLGCPYIYIEGELFDDEGHPGAIAIASMMRYAKKNNEPMMIGFSIEGSTLDRQGNRLAQTVARRVAITLKPCNKSCISDILEENPTFQKAMGNDSFVPLARGMEFDLDDAIMETTVDEDLQAFVEAALELKALNKSLTAGMPMGAPGSNTGGAALQAESSPKKAKKPLSRSELFSAGNRLRAAIRDRQPGQTPVEAVKAELPSLGDKFVEHFDDIMSDLSLRKSARDIVTTKDVLAHVPHSAAQKVLVAGLRAKRLDPDSNWTTANSSGMRVFVRKGLQDAEHPRSTVERAVSFFNLARDFFGLGDNVVHTAGYYHPHDRSMYLAEEYLKKAVNGHHDRHEYDQMIREASRNGSLHRIVIMDFILGHRDRNGLTLVSVEGRPVLIDNHDAFGTPNYPEFIHVLEDHQKMVPMEVWHWLSSLNTKQFARFLLFNGCSKLEASECIRRLEHAQSRVGAFLTLDSLFDDLAQFGPEVTQ